MIKFYNTKMMSPENPGSGSDMPGKGTYAYDLVIKGDRKLLINMSKGNLPTENVITYFESDHPIETEEPDAENQIIYNHDYILQVYPSETALVRESKEMLDAKIRSDVAQSFEESEDPIPDDPGTSQNV